MIARRIVVRGRVQGVGFRYSMVDEARESGVAGWARNCSDGSVEALIQGEPAAVERMIAWSRRGPPAARVTDVVIDEVAVDPRITGFATRPSV